MSSGVSFTNDLFSTIPQLAWIAFAKTGNPNHAKLPRYDAKKRKTIVLNLESNVERDPLGTLHRTMLG